MKYDNAKKYLDSAIKINKDDEELLYFSGMLQMIGKNYNGALLTFTKAIDLKENYGPPYLKRGLIYSLQKNYKYCIRDITNGLQLSLADSSNLEVIRARADANFEIGDFNGAIKDYSRIIFVDAKNEIAYTFRGAAKIEVNDFSSAIEDETKAINLNKKSFVAYNFRGTAKGGIKAYEAALEDLNESISIKVDYPNAYVNRANIYWQKKQKKKACNDLYKADQCGSKIAYKIIEANCKDLDKN